MTTLIAIDDTGRQFQAVAEGACSGGYFALAGSYTNTQASYDAAEWSEKVCRVANTGSGANCMGLFLQDKASGTDNVVTVLRKGVVLVNAVGNVLSGNTIAAAGDGASAGAVGPTTTASQIIGRALHDAASGGLVWVALNV